MCAIVVDVADLGFVRFRWWTFLGGGVGFGVAAGSGSVWVIVTGVSPLEHWDARVPLQEYSGGGRWVGCRVVIFVRVWWFGLRLWTGL